ncbi:MAG: SpoIVB peptidase S55 domain-containing protein [Synergistes sp.]|nr:SpoIVB peptidase S55 domain-containing protein [Synergistes sp.]
MTKIIKIISLTVLSLLLAAELAAAGKFVPANPIMPIKSVKAGMTGYAKTVIKGTEISSFKVKILGVIPKKSKPNAFILIEVLDKKVRANGGIAAGMSGSPVYVDGKIIGAIGYGWGFADHNLGLVTPIEEMMKAADWKDEIPSFKIPKAVDKAEGAENKIVLSGDKAVSRDETVSCDAVASPDVAVSRSGDEIISVDGVISVDEFASRDRVVSCDAAISSDVAVSGDLSADNVEAICGRTEINFEDALESGVIIKKTMPLTVDGISDRYTKSIGADLGTDAVPLGAGGDFGGINLAWKPKPGAAMGAAIIWGDVMAGGIGTLTTVSKDGRFLAFAHPMFNKGAVSYALAEAKIFKIVPSMLNSFKLGTFGSIAGLVTQDRPEAISGYIGKIGAASSYTVKFHNMDNGERAVKRFQTVADPFIGTTVGADALLGVIDMLWAQKGAGTALVTYKVSGGNMNPAWQRKNIFFSSKDVVKSMQKEIKAEGKILAFNHFREISPYGVEVTVEMTKSPRLVYIEKIEIPDEKESYKPGDKLKVNVTFRPWRRRSVVKTFELAVPKDVIGYCEINARGGGIEEPDNEPLLTGIRAISSFKELIRELNAKETNNQIIVEIGGPEKDREKDKDSKDAEKSAMPDEMLEKRFASEIKEEMLENKEIVIADTNYFVEGLVRKFIKVDSGEKNDAIAAMLEAYLSNAAKNSKAGANDSDKENSGEKDDNDDDDDDDDNEDFVILREKRK